MYLAYRKHYPIVLTGLLVLIVFTTFVQLSSTVSKPLINPAKASSTNVPLKGVNDKVSQTTKTSVNSKQTSSVDASSSPITKLVYNDKESDYTKIEYINNRIIKNDNADTLLILSTLADDASYGRDKSFQDLFNTIMSFSYDKNLISLSFLIGTPNEFNKVDLFFNQYFKESQSSDNLKALINKVTILHAPFIEKDFKLNEGEDRESRHGDSVQRLRRRQIARSRNFNVLNGLVNEKYTLFIDADIIHTNHPKMINHFINSKRDIIVPRIQRGDNDDYDKNSWRGERTIPSNDQFKEMDKNNWQNWDYVPRDVDNKMFHLQNHVDEVRNKLDDDPLKNQDYIIPLDSVGGAILFAKSIIYKQGIIFPTSYIIGTTWQRLEGYDGIETEGLCYLANSIGYKCWGMPNLLAQHDAA